MLRRDSMNVVHLLGGLVGVDLVAEEQHHVGPGHGLVERTSGATSARSASTPWVRLPCSSCRTLVRHDPNISRSGLSGTSVAITLGGNGESASGHTCTSSRRTTYGALEPGSRPSISTSA